jgi:hypothetical protein
VFSEGRPTTHPLALHFVWQRQRVRVCMQATMVDDAFLAAEEGEVIAMCSLSEPLDAAALSLAVRWVEQWRVVAWCKVQNARGVAPDTGALLAQFECGRRSWPFDVRPPPWGLSAAGGARKRVVRLRRRWGGRVAMLRPREDVPLESLRAKASLGGRV